MSQRDGVLIALGLLALPVAAQPERHAFVRQQMGTEVRIVLWASDSLTARGAANLAFARIDSLERLLSDYISGSELNRLSATAGADSSVRVSRDLWVVLSRSLALSEETGGAFDVTVGPLTRLWRWAKRRSRLPSEDRLRESRSAVGYSYISLDSTTRSVTLLKDGMRLDLGGIAKGYAADEALRVLRQRGVDRALVDAGGDIAVGRAPPGMPGWTISVGSRLENGVVTLEQRLIAKLGVATSAANYRHIESEGLRISHILDPRSGTFLTSERHVTVVAVSGMEADALASACSVLEPQAARALIERRPTAEIRILTADSTFESSGFQRLMLKR